MQGGLKQLAKEVGVTPSYLCRVFKKTMGVTLGQYIRQFEMTSSKDQTEPSVRAANAVEPQAVDEGQVNPTAVTRTTSPLAPVSDSPTSSPRSSPDFGECIDLDFDFSEWIWTEGIDLNDGRLGAD